jgi:hypothetical protein
MVVEFRSKIMGKNHCRKCFQMCDRAPLVADPHTQFWTWQLRVIHLLCSTQQSHSQREQRLGGIRTGQRPSSLIALTGIRRDT